MRITPLLFTFFALFLATSLPVFGQADTTRTILPDLSPREVEIRGQLEISFPSLQRQPLVGFNPPPRVPELPDNYAPYRELYKQEPADFPDSRLGQPIAPSADNIANGPLAEGELEGSAGRYLSRLLRARIGLPMGRYGSFYMGVDYQGTEGYGVDERDKDLTNPYDATSGNIGFSHSGPRIATGLEFSGEVDAFTLYGGNLLQNDSLSTQVVLPDRNSRTGGVSYWIRNQSNTDLEFNSKLSMSATRVITDIFDGGLSPLPDATNTERRLSGEMNLGVPFSLGAFLASAEGTTSGYNDNGLFSDNLYAVSAAAGFRFVGSSIFSLRVMARMLGANTSAAPEMTSYLTGEAVLEFAPVTGLTLYAQNIPTVLTNSLWEVHRQNPYTVDQPALQPSLAPINAEAGFRYYTGPVKVSIRAGMLQSPNYQFFESESDAPVDGYNYRRGIFTVHYADVQILRVQGDFAITLREGLQAKIGMAVREAMITDTEGHIPYYSPIISRGMLAYRFKENKGLIQVVGSYHSSRHRNRLESKKVDPYIDLDTTLILKLNRGLGVVFRVDNLFASSVEFWEHYAETPLTFSTGLQVVW